MIALVCYAAIRKIILKGKKDEILEKAQLEAESIKQEKIFQAKEKFLQLKSEHEQYINEKNNQIHETENRLKQKENTLNQQNAELGRKQKEADAIRDNLKNQVEIASRKAEEYEKLIRFGALREGEKLAEDVRGRCAAIERMVGEVETRSPERVKEYREKLLARMQEVLADTSIDETRILTEAAIYADKTAVDEETVRLRSHLHQMDGMLQETQPIGRKLDFLVQEMNREANTIGSKANDVAMARIVVDIKSEIEKIREQIQNIE